MKTARGRRWAIGAAVAAAACVAAGGYAFRGIVVEEWYLWELESEDQSRRENAIRTLGNMRSARAASRLVEQMLSSGRIKMNDDDIRPLGWRPYLQVLPEIGVPALPAICRGRGKAEDWQLPYLEKLAEIILSRVTPGDPHAIPGLIEVLSWKGSPLVVKAAWHLKRIGPPAASASPALIALLDDANYPVRHHAALALAKIRPGTVEVIPVLAEILETEKPPPLEAVKALGDCGLAAKDAVPGLIKALKSESARTRAGAAWALGKIGRAARAAGPALEEALDDADPETRRYARWALRRMGLEPRPAVAGGAR